MAKHADACKPDRVRVIRRRKGRCIDCGKPSLPYTRCQTHRFRKSLYYCLNRGARYGLFVKSYPEGKTTPYYSIGDPNAKVGKRGFNKTPWRGGAPRGFFPFVEAYLRQTGTPMHETKIIDAFTEFRRDRAERGHLETTK